MLTRDQEQSKLFHDMLYALNHYSATETWILQNALDKGLEIDVKSLYMLYPFGIDMLRVFLKHASCTSKHLLTILEHHLYRANPYCFKLIDGNNGKDRLDIFFDCINHQKFPATKKEFMLANETLDIFETTKTFERAIDYSLYIQLVHLFLKTHPQSADSISLEKMVAGMMNYYCLYYHRLRDYEISKEDIEKTLLLICQNPEYQSFSSCNTCSNPLFWAARYNYKEFFKALYFHETTPDKIRDAVMYKLKLSVNADFRKEIKSAAEKFILSRCENHYKKNACAFYITMMDPHNSLLANNKDVVFYLCRMLITVGCTEFTATLQSENISPSSSLALSKLKMFQPASANYNNLIASANLETSKYLYTYPRKTGMHRAYALTSILKSALLSQDFKILALYSVLNEATILESRIKNFLNEAISQSADEIKKIANDYAREKNLDLEKLKNNLINLMRNTNIFSSEFKHTEDELLAMISKGAKIQSTNSNRKKWF
jgi:hypothetical protein